MNDALLSTISTLTILPKSGSPLVLPTETNIPSEYLVPCRITLVARDTVFTFLYLSLIAFLTELSKMSKETRDTLSTSSGGLKRQGMSRKYANICWCLVANVSKMFLKLFTSRTTFKKSCVSLQSELSNSPAKVQNNGWGRDNVLRNDVLAWVYSQEMHPGAIAYVPRCFLPNSIESDQ